MASMVLFTFSPVKTTAFGMEKKTTGSSEILRVIELILLVAHRDRLRIDAILSHPRVALKNAQITHHSIERPVEAIGLRYFLVWDFIYTFT